MLKYIIYAAFVTLTPFVFIYILVISLIIYHQNYVNRSQLNANNVVAYAALPTAQNSFSGDISQEDGREEKIRQFFARYRSPLEPYAHDVIAAADEYGLDYRLIPAIAMQESNLCRVIPKDSHNCWGFGIYGKTVTRFSDYKEAIYTVTRTLAVKYKGRGLVTPEQIMTMYTPSSNGSWAFSVNHFMNSLK